jgi:hypothetical protein
MNPEQETRVACDSLEESIKEIAREDLTFERLSLEAKSVLMNTKRLRNLWRSRDPGPERDRAFAKAIDSVDAVLGAFTKRFEQTEKDSLAERDLALEIGDYFGIQGGTHRDWGKFEDAATAYAKGDRFAKRVKVLGGKSNTYCLVQELVNCLLAQPSKVASTEFLEGRLRPALNEIRQVDRTGDPWALADQALITQLVDPRRASEDWDALDDLQPRPEVYAATRNVVVALLDRLRPYLHQASMDSWNDLVDRLK